MQFSPDYLKLDSVGAARLGHLDQLQDKVKRCVLVHSGLGNDKHLRNKISI